MAHRLFNGLTRAMPAASAVFRAAAVPAPLFRVSAVRAFGAGHADTFLDPKVVTERVISVIQNFEKVQAIKSKVTPSARFKEDLDLDSLDAVEVVMAVEEEFGIEIPDSEADKIWSVAEAVAYVSGHPMAK